MGQGSALSVCVANSGSGAYRHKYAVVVATIDEVDDGKDLNVAPRPLYLAQGVPTESNPIRQPVT